MTRAWICAAIVGSLAAALSTAPTSAQTYETGFLNRSLVHGDSTYRYQVFVPHNYDDDSAWPVILFLHGAGERGADGLFQTEVGLGKALRRHMDRYPAIVVFPQAPRHKVWTGDIAEMAMAVLDQTVAEFNTDPDRVYLTGVSMGGNGTYYLAFHHPERFAALAPICGWVGGNISLPNFFPEAGDDPYTGVAERIRGIPAWIFHGEADFAVPVVESRLMYQELDALGSPVTYTELPGTGHESWDPAYLSARFAEWLFQQRRP